MLFDRGAYNSGPSSVTGVFEGALQLTTNDADSPVATVDLAGFWQARDEGGWEPNVNEVWDVFGFGNVIEGLSLNGGGENSVLNFFDVYLPVDETEVLSPYWRIADGIGEAQDHPDRGLSRPRRRHARHPRAGQQERRRHLLEPRRRPEPDAAAAEGQRGLRHRDLHELRRSRTAGTARTSSASRWPGSPPDPTLNPTGDGRALAGAARCPLPGLHGVQRHGLRPSGQRGARRLHGADVPGGGLGGGSDPQRVPGRDGLHGHQLRLQRQHVRGRRGGPRGLRRLGRRLRARRRGGRRPAGVHQHRQPQQQGGSAAELPRRGHDHADQRRRGPRDRHRADARRRRCCGLRDRGRAHHHPPGRLRPGDGAVRGLRSGRRPGGGALPGHAHGRDHRGDAGDRARRPRAAPVGVGRGADRGPDRRGLRLLDRRGAGPAQRRRHGGDGRRRGADALPRAAGRLEARGGHQPGGLPAAGRRQPAQPARAGRRRAERALRRRRPAGPDGPARRARPGRRRHRLRGPRGHRPRRPLRAQGHRGRASDLRGVDGPGGQPRGRRARRVGRGPLHPVLPGQGRERRGHRGDLHRDPGLSRRRQLRLQRRDVPRHERPAPHADGRRGRERRRHQRRAADRRGRRRHRGLLRRRRLARDARRAGRVQRRGHPLGRGRRAHADGQPLRRGRPGRGLQRRRREVGRPGGAARATNVDISNGTGAVGYTAAGEWLEYTINVAAGGRLHACRSTPPRPIATAARSRRQLREGTARSTRAPRPRCPTRAPTPPTPTPLR